MNKDPLGSARIAYVAIPSIPEGGIGMVEIWDAVLKAKWFIGGVTCAFAVAAVIYSLLAAPLYRAEAVLAFAARNQSPSTLGELSGLASLAGISVGDSGDKDEYIALLRSKSFIEGFIRDKKLLPTLFPGKWDAKSRQWIDNEPGHHPDLRDGVNLFIKNIRSVSEDSKTGLVTLSIEWGDPRVAAQWANDLVARINEQIRQRDVTESQQKLDYLNEQLRKANLVEQRQAIAAVIQQQINAMMLARAEKEYAFRVIDPAMVPKRRVWPKRKLIVVAAALFGALASAMLVLLRRALAERRPGSVQISPGEP